jgi:hypothetical protein
MIAAILLVWFAPAIMAIAADETPNPESLSPIPASSAAPEEPGTTNPPEDIQKWIQELESNAYTAREHATERLILAGVSAIPAIRKSIDEGGLESITRGIYVLRQLAGGSSDKEAERAAYDALQAVAERRFTGAARRAASALQSIHEMRYEQAHTRLAQLGAVFSVTNVQVAAQIPQEFGSVFFGPGWRGDLADVELVDWLTLYGPEENKRPLMIILGGDQVDDAWLAEISKLHSIAVVQLRGGRFTEKGLAELQKLPQLEILEMLYAPVGDTAIESLAGFAAVGRMRLVGHQFSLEGEQRLRGMAEHVDFDIRRGGFLGVACRDNPCVVTQVQENTAAEAAGLRVDDVIVSYNQQPVQTMEELTKMISQHEIGKRVSIEVLRGNERVTCEVELGKWDQ